MGRLFSRRKYRDLMLGLALLCAVLALMRWPQESMAAARDGLALCGNVIIPSLFPFFVLSSLVVELGMSRYLGRLLEGVMAPLFRVGGACSSALAWLCRGLPGGGPHCHRPIRERPVLQNRGRTGCWPSATIQVPPLSWGWWAPGSSPAAVRGAPLSGTYRRFPVRRPALPLLPARRGTPAGTTCGPPSSRQPASPWPSPIPSPGPCPPP